MAFESSFSSEFNCDILRRHFAPRELMSRKKWRESPSTTGQHPDQFETSRLGIIGDRLGSLIPVGSTDADPEIKVSENSLGDSRRNVCSRFDSVADLRPVLMLRFAVQALGGQDHQAIVTNPGLGCRVCNPSVGYALKPALGTG